MPNRRPRYEWPDLSPSVHSHPPIHFNTSLWRSLTNDQKTPSLSNNSYLSTPSYFLPTFDPHLEMSLDPPAPQSFSNEARPLVLSSNLDKLSPDPTPYDRRKLSQGSLNLLDAEAFGLCVTDGAMDTRNATDTDDQVAKIHVQPELPSEGLGFAGNDPSGIFASLASWDVEEEDGIVHTQFDPVRGHPPQLLTPSSHSRSLPSSPSSSPIEEGNPLSHLPQRQVVADAGQHVDHVAYPSVRLPSFSNSTQGTPATPGPSPVRRSYKGKESAKSQVSSHKRQTSSTGTAQATESVHSGSAPQISARSPPSTHGSIVVHPEPLMRQAALAARLRLKQTTDKGDVLSASSRIGRKSKRARDDDEYIPEAEAQTLKRRKFSGVARAPPAMEEDDDEDTEMGREDVGSNHKCNDCNKTFQRRSDLTRHMHNSRAHASTTQWQCHLCNTILSRQDALQRHQRTNCSGQKKGQGSTTPRGREASHREKGKD